MSEDIPEYKIDRDELDGEEDEDEYEIDEDAPLHEYATHRIDSSESALGAFIAGALLFAAVLLIIGIASGVKYFLAR